MAGYSWIPYSSDPTYEDAYTGGLLAFSTYPSNTRSDNYYMGVGVPLKIFGVAESSSGATDGSVYVCAESSGSSVQSAHEYVHEGSEPSSPDIGSRIAINDETYNGFYYKRVHRFSLQLDSIFYIPVYATLAEGLVACDDGNWSSCTTVSIPVQWQTDYQTEPYEDTFDITVSES